MGATTTKRELTAGHGRFAALLEQIPWLRDYWDFDANEPACEIEQLEGNMGTWSHGERSMATFMGAAWIGENRLQFDAIEAASVLDPDYSTDNARSVGSRGKK